MQISSRWLFIHTGPIPVCDTCMCFGNLWIEKMQAPCGSSGTAVYSGTRIFRTSKCEEVSCSNVQEYSNPNNFVKLACNLVVRKVLSCSLDLPCSFIGSLEWTFKRLRRGRNITNSTHVFAWFRFDHFGYAQVCKSESCSGTLIILVKQAIYGSGTERRTRCP